MSAPPRPVTLPNLRISLDGPPAPPPDGPQHGGRFAAGVIGAVVVLVVAAVAVTVAVAASYKPAGGATPGVVVFTVAAPYHPGDPEAATIQAVPPPAPIGNWTYQRGEQIARRAVSWIGWPYSWAAGDANGPTYGVAVDAASRNDGQIRGFDCSGLVIYALAPWLSVVHDAASQYTQAGTVHPSLSSLQPGDLIFWSKDGTIGGIGHVAIYIGNGNVVQAPYSGAYVEVTPLDQVEPGRIGVTRPLT